MRTVALILLLTAAGPLLAAELEYLNPPASQALDLPFSEAVRVDGVLYLAGQIGAAPGEMGVMPGGIRAETRQALTNIRAVLTRHGSGLNRVAKCTVFLRDIAEWPIVNEVWREFFSAPFPARSALATSGLAMNARVEIECIAAL